MMWFAALGAGLIACSHTPAPVEDLSSRTTGGYKLGEDGLYRVKTGDTLYSIAFNYSLDWKDIASWNGVSRPYTIWPGQDLHLAPPGSRSTRAASTSTTAATTITTRPAGSTPRATTRPADIPAPRSTTTAQAPPVADEPSPVVAHEPLPPVADGSSPSVPVEVEPATTIPATTIPAVAESLPPVTEPVAESAPASRPPAGPLSNPERWQWPTSGPVINSFNASDPARKGIDIAGEEGQDIFASATGDVVYSGNGLIGFGELIIIKHSDSMLTAYAYNSIRLVQEGERVAAGSKIAEMGRSPQNKTLLHFELRVNGKPVDPLRHLPPR